MMPRYAPEPVNLCVVVLDKRTDLYTVRIKDPANCEGYMKENSNILYILQKKNLGQFKCILQFLHTKN